jgi:predicted ATPase with chaperone activity
MATLGELRELVSMEISVCRQVCDVDLAIAVASLAAAGDLRPSADVVFLAEHGLDDRLRPIRGVLPAVMAAVRPAAARAVRVLE